MDIRSSRTGNLKITALNPTILILKICVCLHLMCFVGIMQRFRIRGQPLMIGGGGNREKKFRGPSPGKKDLEGLPKKNWRGNREEKINSFSIFPAPPIINGRPLRIS